MTGKRSALIVATSKYKDTRLPPLEGPGQDAEALRAVLANREIGGFDVRLALNSRVDTLRRTLESFFADRARDDLLLVHFSGHGLKDDDGQLFLAATDTQIDRLLSTGVDAGWVNRLMNKCRSEKIALFLDCCFAGAFTTGMTRRVGVDTAGVKEHFTGRGLFVITASDAMQYSFEGGHQVGQPPEPSPFTKALVDGLHTGEADRNEDGDVSINELFDFLEDRIRETSPSQTPTKSAFNQVGDWVIARSSREPSIRLLPDTLQTQLKSDLALDRLGAIIDLRDLIDGPDRRLAAAARSALERLLLDDSQRVAAAAQRVLQEEATTPRSSARVARRRAAPVMAETPSIADQVAPITQPPADPAPEPISRMASAVDDVAKPVDAEPSSETRVSNRTQTPVEIEGEPRSASPGVGPASLGESVRQSRDAETQRVGATRTAAGPEGSPRGTPPSSPPSMPVRDADGGAEGPYVRDHDNESRAADRAESASDQGWISDARGEEFEARIERPVVRGGQSGSFSVVVANHRPGQARVRVTARDPSGTLVVRVPDKPTELESGAIGNFEVRISSPKRRRLFASRHYQLDILVDAEGGDTKILPATFAQQPIVPLPLMASLVGAGTVAAIVAQAGLFGGQPPRTSLPTASPGSSIAPSQPAVAVWAVQWAQTLNFGSATGPPEDTKDGLAEVQFFAGGRVYLIKATGVAAPLMGAIKDDWVRRGGTPPKLGYPLTGEISFEPNYGPKYPFEEFERGYLLCVPANPPGCAVFLTKPIFKAWEIYRGKVGYPLQDVHPLLSLSGVTGASFERGAIYTQASYTQVSAEVVVCTRSGTTSTVIAPSPPPRNASATCARFK